MASTKVPIELSSTPGIVDNSNATAITIDSSENVGIGTNSPSGALHVSRSGLEAGITLERTTSATAKFTIAANDGNLVFTDQNQSAERMRIDSSGNVTVKSSGELRIRDDGTFIKEDQGLQIGNTSGTGTTRPIRFFTESSERMRIDSSGNLLVSTTSSNYAVAGSQLGVGGNNYMTRSGAQPLLLNRLSSDGDVLLFMKDGSTVGSIESVSGAGLSYNSANGLLKLCGNQTDHIEIITLTASGAPRIQPSRDNTVDLGQGARRFQDVFATNGTINTSDRNEKQDIEALTDAETRVAVAAKGLLRKFRWQSAVASKGDDARIHFGIIAQDLQDAFTAEGLDASRYAMFCSDTWTDEETGEERTRLGVRYSELLAFIIAAI